MTGRSGAEREEHGTKCSGRSGTENGVVSGRCTDRRWLRDRSSAEVR